MSTRHTYVEHTYTFACWTLTQKIDIALKVYGHKGIGLTLVSFKKNFKFMRCCKNPMKESIDEDL